MRWKLLNRARHWLNEKDIANMVSEARAKQYLESLSGSKPPS